MKDKLYFVNIFINRLEIKEIPPMDVDRLLFPPILNKTSVILS